MVDFKIAKPSTLVTAIVKPLLPLYLRFRYGDTELRVTQATLAIFAALRSKPALICPNHSHHEDGEIVFWLSLATRTRISIMTARELFENYLGFGGFMLQRLGCFSISRGGRDARAIRFTEQLLENSHYKVVLFPEGEISFDEHNINPLETGAAYMALEACKRLLRESRPADVYVVPLAISYHYNNDISAVCGGIVSKLECHLGLSRPIELTERQRAKVVAESIVGLLEKNLSISSEVKSLDRRLQKIVEATVENYESVLSCPLPAMPLIGKIHVLQSKLLDLKLAGNHTLPLDQIQCELLQAIAFLSINESRFTSSASQECFADALAVLEEYLLGRVSRKGPRTVTLTACEPLNVLSYIQDYLHCRSETVHMLTDTIASRLRGELRRRHYAPPRANSGLSKASRSLSAFRTC